MSSKIGHSGLAFARMWHHIDMAKDQRSLGRIASSIAIILIGKHKPVYHHTQDSGDYMVVTNCSQMKITGKKFKDKTYWSHTGRPGRLSLTPMETIATRKGYGELLKKAVSGMLPKNRLRKIRLERLKVFDSEDHPYKANITKIAGEETDIVKMRDLGNSS